MLTEHAGFLMALGLNGHLNTLAVLNKFEYLVKCHEMTSVGLLLGIAASKRGILTLSFLVVFIILLSWSCFSSIRLNNLRYNGCECYKNAEHSCGSSFAPHIN